MAKATTGAARVDISLHQTNYFILVESCHKTAIGAILLGDNVKVQGYIDEVRISNVVRYDGRSGRSLKENLKLINTPFRSGISMKHRGLIVSKIYLETATISGEAALSVI